MENKYPYIGKCVTNGMISLFHDKSKGQRIAPCNDGAQRFIDESLYSDITADYLRNTKIRIESLEHSKFVQKLVFSAGGKWGMWSIGSRNVMINPEAKYLFIDDCLALDSFTDNHDTYKGEIIREIKLPIPPQEKQADEWPQVGDIVSLRYKYDNKSIHLTGNLEFLSSKHIIVNDCHKLRCDYEIEKPITDQEALANLIFDFGFVDEGYSEHLAKAIVAGEIEGLEYKGVKND